MSSLQSGCDLNLHWFIRAEHGLENRHGIFMLVAQLKLLNDLRIMEGVQWVMGGCGCDGKGSGGN